MTFNEKIDKFMKDNNYNLKQLAIASDIPYTTLNDFYHKKSADNSRLSTIRKLSKFMNCSMDYLSYDEITEPNNKLIENLNNINKVEEDLSGNLSILDNVLYSNKNKIDSVKNLPREKQEVIANAVKSVLDMIDE